MAQHNVPDKWALQRIFQQRVAQMAAPLNRTFVVWEEAWNGTKLPPDTVVQVWRQQGGALADVLRSGYRALFSPDEYWYLDKLSGHDAPPGSETAMWATMQGDWWNMYSVDPLANISAAEAAGLLGGEVCMWSSADATNLFPLTFPRASAVAEVLWSGAREDKEAVALRLSAFRCRLTRRGIPAASVGHATARLATPPGFCALPFEFQYNQPRR